MKSRIVLGILVLFSFTAFAEEEAGSYTRVGTYALLSAPSIDIDNYYPIGSDATHTPTNLQGLWWMDGNPLADKIISFATLKFTNEKDAKGNLIHRTLLPVYDEGVWSWDDTPKGHLLYQLVHDVQLTYLGVFNADYSHGDVTPIVTPQLSKVPVAIPQSELVDFTMTKVGPDEFSRDSILLGKHFTYRLRRIVDASGHRLPAYDDYVKQIETKGPKHAWVPVCFLDSGTHYPTICAKKLTAKNKKGTP